MDWLVDAIGWILVIALFAAGMIGAVYPPIPGAAVIFGAFVVYGLFFGWSGLGFWFWAIQIFILAVLTVADYLVSVWGVKRFGGGKGSVWGSMIGLILGPFVIPVLGLVIGPFAGAVLGELLAGTKPEAALRAGVGALVGLLTSVFVKIILQSAMIVLFFIWIF